MMSQIGQQMIKIRILTNLSRSKGNQAIESDQLKEYILQTFFFKNLGKRKILARIHKRSLFYKNKRVTRHL